MKITYQKPFGVKVTDVDVKSPKDMARIRELLWENAFVLLPAGAARPGCQPTHLDKSISVLGSLFGEPDRGHPVHPNSPESEYVHVVESSGDSGNPPDSYLFHSDISWRVNPPRVTVLCGRRMPSRGGDTWFQNTNIMYELLSPELQEKVCNSTFKHSFKLGFGRVSVDTSNVAEDATALHPGVIMHPETGSPLLYVNEMFTERVHGMEPADSDAMIKEIFSQAYSQAHTVIHKWTLHDVLIWDNIGIQHLGTNDYNELRRMHRLVAGQENLRFERYTGRDACIEEDADALCSFLERQDHSIESANSYDRDARKAEYVVPSVATDLLNKHLKKGKTEGQAKPLVLDVAAGTGRNAIHLAFDHQLDNIEAMDISEPMLHEARRRELYKKYNLSDANREFPMVADTYDAVICTGGLSKGLINPDPAIANMIRVTKPGGLIVITTLSDESEYDQAVRKMTHEGQAKVEEAKPFVGIRTLPSIEHVAYVLRVI